MSDKTRDYELELARFMNAMAESVADMSDEQIDEELAEEAVDTDQIRQVLRDAIKKSQQARLAEAQRKYEQSLASFYADEFEIPVEVPRQRELITVILAGNPQIGTGLLTAQYRDLKDLPDEDVESYLRQLMTLIKSQASGTDKSS
jgi:hypothetical protein